MTQRLYRITLVVSALAWLQAGMHLSHLASVKDAGRTPEASEWIVLVLVLVWAIGGVLVLWRQPVVAVQAGASAPAA